MDYKDVNRLIEEGEGFEIEFKRKVSSPEKIARAMIAFANTRGGHILFGVDDDGSIVGVESEKSEVDLIHHAGIMLCLPEIIPHIDIVPFDGKDVIVAYVRESGNKPHYFTGASNGDARTGEETKVFIRVNDKTVMASREVVKILRGERPDGPPVHIEIGENEKRLFKYLDSNERITIKEFSDLVNISEQRASRILVALVRAGVVRIHTLEKRDYFTLAYDITK
ncbi:MAG: putative DNA binding domain-containing protein [Ignavibacteriae bacterium]|nr:putative DNA binding domain-containing protein [Ignavibacteriota bacterium]